MIRDNFTLDDFDSLRLLCKLIQKVLDVLFGSLFLANDVAYEMNLIFHIWPSIYIHDPMGSDDTATWLSQTDVKVFNYSRY
jgi:hypothetical protein